MKMITVTKGEFRATLETEYDDKVRITFVIPANQIGVNADDYCHILDHIIELSKNKDGSYRVDYTGLDTSKSE